MVSGYGGSGKMVFPKKCTVKIEIALALYNCFLSNGHLSALKMRVDCFLSNGHLPYVVKEWSFIQMVYKNF